MALDPQFEDTKIDPIIRSWLKEHGCPPNDDGLRLMAHLQTYNPQGHAYWIRQLRYRLKRAKRPHKAHRQEKLFQDDGTASGSGGA